MSMPYIDVSFILSICYLDVMLEVLLKNILWDVEQIYYSLQIEKSPTKIDSDDGDIPF